MPDPYLGQIELFAFNFAPQKWAVCAGQLMNIFQYTALFSLLGTTYGGDGRTTFALPNLQGRAAVGFGDPPGRPTYKLGLADGQETVLLTQDTLPAHSHSLVASAQTGTTSTPNGQMLAVPRSGLTDPSLGRIYNAASPNQSMSEKVITPSGSASPLQPHDNMQPSLALNYCICLDGIFPTRS
jgi:microcystin-dependent protein